MPSNGKPSTTRSETSDALHPRRQNIPRSSTNTSFSLSIFCPSFLFIISHRRMINIIFSLGSVFPARVPNEGVGCIFLLSPFDSNSICQVLFLHGFSQIRAGFSLLLARAEYASSDSYSHSYGALMGGLFSCLLAVSFGLHIVLWSETD